MLFLLPPEDCACEFFLAATEPTLPATGFLPFLDEEEVLEDDELPLLDPEFFAAEASLAFSNDFSGVLSLC